MSNAWETPIVLDGSDVGADREGNQLISSLRAAWRDDFNGTELNPDLWEVVRNDPGQSIALTGVGELTINAGTTADEQTIIRSVDTYSIPTRVWFIGRLSQRIIDQTFFLELVNAAGDMAAQWVIDGTSATVAKINALNGGNGALSTNLTITSTASDTIFEIELFSDEAWFAQRSPNSGGGKASSFVRHANIPDPNDKYFVQIRAVNGAVAPASATSLILGAICVQDINQLTAEITGGRGDNAGAKAIGVNLINTAINIVPSATVGTASYNTARVSLATANATSVKTTAGTIGTLVVANTSASWRWLKLFNKTSAPTMGTDSPVMVIGIPPGQTVVYQNPMPIRFLTGIAYAITANPADLDTTAIGAGDVVLSISYT